MNPDDIAAQVMENCSIANARNWGSYSVCGLLLRLRELYKWEKNLKPWEPIEHGALLAWIDTHERRWESLADNSFESIRLDGRDYDPFDVEKINKVIEDTGVIYGAGFTKALRPSFFLAELLDRRRIDGFPVLILGEELARDLVSYPAMALESVIFVRKQPMSFYLWEKLLEARGQRQGLLSTAFQDYGYDFSKPPETQIELMERIIREELHAYLRHEISEAKDTVFPRTEWKEIVAGHPGTRIEHFARGIRDILGDTCDRGMLSYIIETRNLGSLGMYTANLSGFRKLILPEMVEVYKRVRETGDWGLVEKIRRKGYEAAMRHAEELTDMYRLEKSSGRFKELAEELLSHFRF